MGRIASAGDHAASESLRALVQENILGPRRRRTSDELPTQSLLTELT
jgi:hypothetical protein